MRVSWFLSYYVGLSVIFLFTGFAYETETFVLRPFDAMVGFGVVLLAANASWRGYARRFDKGLPYYLFATLYLYRGLSGLVMTGPALGVKELLQGLEFIFLIHLVVKATKRQDDRRRFLQTLYIGFGCIAVVTALLHIMNGRYSGYKYLADFGYTTGGASKYAFGLFGLMALVFWMDRKNAYTILLFTAAIFLAFLSGERKGWVAMAAAGAAIYYTESNFRLLPMLRNFFRTRYLVVVGLIVVGGVMTTNYNYAGRQIESLTSAYELMMNTDFEYIHGRHHNLVGRYNGLVYISDMLSKHPFFGVGTERAKKTLYEFANPNLIIATGHGEYQRYALENGIIGLLLYTSIWVFVLRSVYKIIRRRDLDYLSTLFLCGFATYSAIVNMFMGGGAHNIMFTSVSIGLLISYRNRL